jgi:hypothetical protein
MPYAADDFAEIAANMKKIHLMEEDVDEYYCIACEGGGWEYYGLGRGDPHFRECTVCYNPQGLSHP